MVLLTNERVPFRFAPDPVTSGVNLIHRECPVPGQVPNGLGESILGCKAPGSWKVVVEAPRLSDVFRSDLSCPGEGRRDVANDARLKPR